MTSVSSSYTKPFLSVDEQIDRLQERGLEIESRHEAAHHLRRIGYYRLSGYWFPFRQDAPAPGKKRPSEFRTGTSLAVILEAYDFDERLRASLMSAIARVEVNLRFRIGHALGKYGPFAHCDPVNLDPMWSRQELRSCSAPNCTPRCAWMSSDHETWLERQKTAESIPKEAFITHIHGEYGTPLPVWVATEVMSFGSLNRLMNGMKQRDRQQLAADFDIVDAQGNGDAAVLSNWVEHLRQVRNACAHHARLWNKNIDAIISVPAGVPELAHLINAQRNPQEAMDAPSTVRRIYGTLAILTFLLVRTDGNLERRNLVRLEIEKFASALPGRLDIMGFPVGWAAQDLWQEGYGRDAERARHAELMRSTRMLMTQEAAEALTVKETAKERRSLLNYYRKNGALLSAPWTESHSYPKFQFDQTTGDVPQPVIAANRRLMNGSMGSDTERWQALEWWMTSQPEALNGLTPAAAVEAGRLTLDVLNNMLSPRADEIADQK
ncbi:Abi family protein [Arthrobacter sp. FW305-123]|nr:Abi family protein [Arthrobacter sp. FW305-123]